MSMPYGGNDWLALTQEPTLEPELPICDPHHHFWDRRLQSLPYQRYLLDELHADISSGHNVRSTVFLEARSMYRPDGPVAMRPVGEVEFVQGLAAASASGIYGPSRAAAAIIGHADLKLGAHVAPVLDALQVAGPNRVRGIRHNVTWRPDPPVVSREREGILATATFRGGAVPIGSEALAADMAPWMQYCIEQFGPGRCMFESNFPPDKVSFSYHVMYNAFKRLSRAYSPAERAAMFHNTAAKVYRIDV